MNSRTLRNFDISALQKTLDKHIEFAHSGRTLHLCNVCGQLCSNEASLRAHMLQHQGNRTIAGAAASYSNSPAFSMLRYLQINNSNVMTAERDIIRKRD